MSKDFRGVTLGYNKQPMGCEAQLVGMKIGRGMSGLKCLGEMPSNCPVIFVSDCPWRRLSGRKCLDLHAGLQVSTIRATMANTQTNRHFSLSKIPNYIFKT